MNISNNATSFLRTLIASGEFLPMPCCFDALSAKLIEQAGFCLLYTSPSPRDYAASRMPSSA